jgi:hypothetical protein
MKNPKRGRKDSTQSQMNTQETTKELRAVLLLSRCSLDTAGGCGAGNRGWSCFGWAIQQFGGIVWTQAKFDQGA